MSRVNWLEVGLLIFIAAHSNGAEPERSSVVREPIVLKKGPRLLLDDHLIVRIRDEMSGRKSDSFRTPVTAPPPWPARSSGHAARSDGSGECRR